MRDLISQASTTAKSSCSQRQSSLTRICGLFLLSLWFVAELTAQPAFSAPPALPPSSDSANSPRVKKLEEITSAVNQAIEAGQLPGCVVLVSHQGKIIWLKGYGFQQVEPEKVEMQTDAVFDLASLTKPIATATSVMLLVEQGKLNLDEKAATYWPEFGVNGKSEITLRQLLTHQSGLIADNALRDYRSGPEAALENVANLKLVANPGEKFIYSDVGFIVLAELVRKVSGESIDQFSQKQIFAPLGMQDTSYGPLPEKFQERTVPTEKRNDQWIRGEVHDPRAHFMQGVAGHAGLFSTAEDLAVYAQMLLNEGTYQGVKILSPETVKSMTTPHPVGQNGKRGLGWDMLTGYSSNRGKNFSDSAYGHGGFTGTAFWNDPKNQLSVIFLSSRLHPTGKGAVNQLAGKIGMIAAEAILIPADQNSANPTDSDSAQ